MTTGLCVKAERVKQNRTGDRGCHPHTAVVTLQRCSTFDTSTVLGVGFSLLAGDVGRRVEQRRQVRFQRRVWFQCLRTSSASAAPLASITQLNGCCRSHGGTSKQRQGGHDVDPLTSNGSSASGDPGCHGILFRLGHGAVVEPCGNLHPLLAVGWHLGSVGVDLVLQAQRQGASTAIDR